MQACEAFRSRESSQTTADDHDVVAIIRQGKHLESSDSVVEESRA